MAYWLLLLVVVGASAIPNPAANDEGQSQGRILGLGLPSLFSITPYSCELSDDLGTGTCYTLLDCLKNGGTAHGKCAGIFGVCCNVAEVEGNTTITANGGTFVSPGYSSSRRSLDSIESRSYENQVYVGILTPSSEYVQMHLEFSGFDIVGPTEGECDTDMFELTGYTGSAQVPTLCGENAGQHMYVDLSKYDSSSDYMTLQITHGSTVYDRKWRIVVTYYTSYQTTDPRCLQYFTAASGSITSFNYGTSPQNLNNQAYSVCFYNADYCDIGFTFNTIDLGNSIGDCMDTYVQLQTETLCGSQTDYTVIGNSTSPITLTIASDTANADEVEGFEVDYTMMSC